MDLYTSTYHTYSRPTTGSTNYSGTTPNESSQAAGKIDETEKSSQTRKQDSVTISNAGQEKSREQTSTRDSQKFEEPDTKQLNELKKRDAEVRQHEQAHLSAAGRYSRGGASYTLEKGPDGKAYAVAGEVGIDVSKERTPEETITKMQTVRGAALAPANPSSADRQIAAQASAKEAQARQEILSKQQELFETEEQTGEIDSTSLKNDTDETSSHNETPSYNSLKAGLATYQQMAQSYS